MSARQSEHMSMAEFRRRDRLILSNRFWYFPILPKMCRRCGFFQMNHLPTALKDNQARRGLNSPSPEEKAKVTQDFPYCENVYYWLSRLLLAFQAVTVIGNTIRL